MRSPPPPRDAFQRELMARYSGVGVRMGTGRVRFHVKRAAFVVVVAGTKLLKRVVDIVVSAIALVLLAPLFAVLSVAIRLDSEGPALFRQTRIGAYGKPFTMYKFRTMHAGADARKAELADRNEMEGGVLFKIKDDPRVTRLGRFLRKSSIDEMPQFWNVLMGAMSLVGPRPAIPSEVEDYTVSDRTRLEVPPGITCIWQVTGRSDIPFDKQVELDTLYIESQTFWGDLKLLLKTIPAVLLGRGAY